MSRTDIDEIVRTRKRSESFDVKYLGFVLVDLVPYERKSDMVAGFDDLFSLEHRSKNQ